MFEGRNLACMRGGRLVFTDVRFKLDAGDSLIVAGPNGSGKSTLLRLMAGLLPAASGEIVWKGAPIAEDPESFHGKLHYSGHLDAIKPTMTVAENVAFWIDLRSGDRSRLLPALEAVGLGELRDLPARVLSTGQRRRVGLARLSAVPAPLWLLDEPTIALDTGAVAALFEAIASHRRGGGAAVIATNVPIDIPEAARLELVSGEPDDGDAFWR